MRDAVNFATVEEGIGLGDTYTPQYLVTHTPEDDAPRLILATDSQTDALSAYKAAINGDGYSNVILAYRG